MICENCGKREAAVHLREISGNQMKDLHLCTECAAIKGVTADTIHVNLTSLIQNLVAESMPSLTDEGTADLNAADICCPECGWTAADLQSSGRLGCPACYSAFEELLKPILRQVHRGSRHKGHDAANAAGSRSRETAAKARYAGAGATRSIAQLREELARAVATEEYEHAARLRDEIARIQGCGQDSGNP